MQPTMKPSLLLATLIGSCLAGSVHAENSAIDHAIAQHRMGTLIIHAEPGVELRVEQLRHEFWFGAALSSRIFAHGVDSNDAVKYKQVFLDNFNAAVTENALKWHAMEPSLGQVDYSIVDAMLDWTQQFDVPLRGHNIYWGVPNRVPAWQKSLDDDRLGQIIRNRALVIGRRYQGRFAEYDLNNEMMHANYYEDRLGPEITKQMADWVKQGDPNAVLYVNDYDVLTGNRLDDYVAHVRKLLDSGTPIDGIGVQGHLHGDSFDPAAVEHALDVLAELGLPIRVTEFNLPGQRSGFYRDTRRRLSPAQEQAKAKAIVDYYRICFAHPAVQGILMWGFWEGANWIPVSSLYRRDWSPTPAAHAYRDLVYNQWWTKWKGTVGASRRCEVRIFYGKHRIVAGDKETTVHLRSDEGTKSVSF